MDLKFTFEGASPDRLDAAGRGDAPSGIPLPFSVGPSGTASTSSVLEIAVRRSGAAVLAEVVSGDGVTYARSEVAEDARDPASLARSVRSALARAVAELEGPLAESVTAVVLDLGDAGSAVLGELGLDTGAPAVDDALQRRIGIASGTPIRLADRAA